MGAEPHHGDGVVAIAEVRAHPIELMNAIVRGTSPFTEIMPPRRHPRVSLRRSRHDTRRETRRLDDEITEAIRRRDLIEKRVDRGAIPVRLLKR